MEIFGLFAGLAIIGILLAIFFFLLGIVKWLLQGYFLSVHSTLVGQMYEGLMCILESILTISVPTSMALWFSCNAFIRLIKKCMFPILLPAGSLLDAIHLPWNSASISALAQ